MTTANAATKPWVITSGAAFVIPLLLGTGLLRLRKITNVVRVEGDVPFAATSSSVYFNSPTPPTKPPLTERLQQLEDARNAGLISPEEYERARQVILKGGG